MATDTATDAPLMLGTHELKSRLIVGTGKYATFEQMRDCLEASGSEVITVAVRRERLIAQPGADTASLAQLDDDLPLAAARLSALLDGRGR